MPYVKQKITALIDIDPAKAEGQIIAAFYDAKASRMEAAKLLGVTRGTLASWIDKLAMWSALERLEEQAKDEGWHHGRLGGAPRKKRCKTKKGTKAK